MSEQVSHHPPVSAFHAEGLKEDFVFHGSIYPKLKFWGKSIEAEPKGVITLELPKWAHTEDCFINLFWCILVRNCFSPLLSAFFVSVDITKRTPGQTPPVASTTLSSVSFGLSSMAAWKCSITSKICIAVFSVSVKHICMHRDLDVGIYFSLALQRNVDLLYKP